MGALRKPLDLPNVDPPRQTGRVHVSFPMELSALLRLRAAERREHTESMIVALIDYVEAHGLADGMLEALRDSARPGQGRIVAGGETLTHNQAAVLYLIGQHRDGDGYCRISSDGLAMMAGLRQSSVNGILASLAKRRIIARCINVAPIKSRALVAWGLTRSGRVIWRDLARGEAP